MATVTFYRAGNMLNPAIWYGTPTSYSSSHITISGYPYVGTYYGSFVYTAYDLAGGTATGYTQTYLGSLDYTVTGGSVDALTVYNLLLSGDPVGVQQYALQYSDIIQGSAFADALRGWSGNDTITGGGGGDTLLGDDGNDIAYGEAGNDVLQGGTGDDILYGGAGFDLLYGEDGNDWLLGDADNDTLYGGQGNDSLFGAAGNDLLDGGTGLDIAHFNGNRSDYTITNTVSGLDGSDLISGIERLYFADKRVALDLGVGEAANNTVRIIGAAFDGPAVQQHPEWVGVGLNLFDSGTSMQAVSELVVQILGLSNTAFVNTVYENVVGAPPSDAVRDFYVGLLQGSGGTMTQAQLLEIAANADINAQNINLVGLQASGVDFV